MIIRNKRINVNANEIQMAVSYSYADVLSCLRKYAYLCTRGDKELEEDWLNTPIKEKEMRHWFEESPEVFGNYQIKWRESLSAWAWNLAVREEYFISSSTPGKDGYYYPAASLLKRVGRPRKTD